MTRVLEGLASEDTGERERTAVLAAHIEIYSVYRRGTVWLLPLPLDGAHRLPRFPFPEIARDAARETAR